MIIFEEWEKVLKVGVSPDHSRAFREAIVKFRYWLRETDQKAVAETFKRHFDWKQTYFDSDRFAISQGPLNRIQTSDELVAGLAVSDDA